METPDGNMNRFSLYLTTLATGTTTAEISTADELKKVVVSALASALVLLIHTLIEKIKKK